MECLQYSEIINRCVYDVISVLNLVINGMPSILEEYLSYQVNNFGFKPCYKWNAFNTLDFNKNIDFMAS